MNLIDPNDLAKALAPILDKTEQNIVAGVNKALQSAIDRLHGIKVTAEIDIPPAATPI